MPTFRIFYVEHEEAASETALTGEDAREADLEEPDDVSLVEWEETVDARSTIAALESFFGQHAANRNDVRLIEEDGEAHALGGSEDFDPDRTYIWMEDGKLMEYQGVQESTPGMVTCPLCDGTGEVEEETADKFLEEWEQVEE
jgi:hypothetical protein